MPKAMEKKLKAEARKKGLTGERAKAYVYGTMNKQGLMKGSKVTAKGKRAEKKSSKRATGTRRKKK